MKTDWLIIGAGFTGSVLAERIASQLEQSVLLVDQRPHLGGNAYDYYDEHGILVHQYGPHIFHTNAQTVWDYLSQFTTWRRYYHQVVAMVDGIAVPVPFNLNSLYRLFPAPYADKLSQQLIEQYGFNVKVSILKIRETAQGDLKFLADYIYEKIFHHYTLKQWGVKPEELSPSVTARVPILINRDDRYFQDRFQGMPKDGYTVLFQRLLSHTKIRWLLNTSYQDVVDEIQYKKMIFTGPLDEFFHYQLGELPYRSLRFQWHHAQQEQIQPVATVNYPNEYDYTRTTEFKQLTGQQVHGSSYVIEYPQLYRRGVNIPYYPIPKEENRTLYKQYELEAEKCQKHILFAGRLADYQYYNMDQAVARALSLFEKTVCQMV